MYDRETTRRLVLVIALGLVALLGASPAAQALPGDGFDFPDVPEPLPEPEPEPEPMPPLVEEKGAIGSKLDELPALPACPRFEPIGSNPPEVLPSQQGADAVKTLKAANPSATTYTIAVLRTTGPDAWRLTMEEVGLPSNMAIVKLDARLLGWEKAMTTVNGADCNAGGTILHAPGGSTSLEVLITKADTTTLVLSKPVCDFLCFWTHWEDVAVWDQNGFWEFFGGRKVTFTWVFD